MDHDLSVTCVLALVTWALSIAAMLVGFVAGDLRYMGVGLWLCGAGAVLAVRQMVCNALRRSHAAFDLGRDHERNNIRRI